MATQLEYEQAVARIYSTIEDIKLARGAGAPKEEINRLNDAHFDAHRKLWKMEKDGDLVGLAPLF